VSVAPIRSAPRVRLEPLNVNEAADAAVAIEKFLLLMRGQFADRDIAHALLLLSRRKLEEAFGWQRAVVMLRLVASRCSLDGRKAG